MRRRSLLWRAYSVVMAGMLLSGNGIAQTAEEPERPWTLRNMYSFPMGTGVFDFDETHGEIRLRSGDITLFASVGCQVRLEDGTLVELSPGATERQTADGPLGVGNQYVLTFPEKDGLVVTLTVRQYRMRSFLQFWMTVKNTGEEAVAIQKLSPIVITPEGVLAGTKSVTFTTRPYSLTGPFARMGHSETNDMVLFHTPEQGMCAAFGILPGGDGQAGVHFLPSGEVWQGEVSTNFTPALVLAPGKTLSAAPLWIALGSADTLNLDENYAWSCKVLGGLEAAPENPRAWVTVEEGASLSALTKLAQQARSVGVQHALIPRSWEGRPGSLQGASPQYPRNMASAAKTLSGIGVEPGLTLEPLLADKVKGDWTVDPGDGRIWVNPDSAEGREYLLKCYTKVKSWGFSFLVMYSTEMPEAVLRHFKLSRAKADALALAILAEATELPVSLAGGGSLRPERDVWLAAAETASQLDRFGVSVGAIHLNLSGSGKAIDKETALAMRLFPGPIALTAVPQGKNKETLRAVLQAPILTARSVDGYLPAPMVWRYESAFSSDALSGNALLAFNGDASEVLTKLDFAEVHLWCPKQSEMLSSLAEHDTHGTALAVHGLIPKSEAPIFVGLSTGPVLHLDYLKNISWQADKGILEILFTAPPSEKCEAFIWVKTPSTFHSAKVNGRSVKPKIAGNRVLLEVDDKTTRIEVKFN